MTNSPIPELKVTPFRKYHIQGNGAGPQARSYEWDINGQRHIGYVDYEDGGLYREHFSNWERWCTERREWIGREVKPIQVAVIPDELTLKTLIYDVFGMMAIIE